MSARRDPVTGDPVTVDPVAGDPVAGDPVTTTTVDTPLMGGTTRCGTGVPLDRLAPGDRQAVEDFRRYLSGDMGDEERAAYEQGRPAGGELGEAPR